MIKRLSSVSLSRKNELLPFENLESVAFLCEKQIAALFAFGFANQKQQQKKTGQLSLWKTAQPSGARHV